MHETLDILLIAACLIMLAGWLTADSKVRLVCADLAMKASKYARREAECKAREATAQLRVENHQEQIRDLERRLRDHAEP
jgi:hypothetical protein